MAQEKEESTITLRVMDENQVFWEIPNTSLSDVNLAKNGGY